MYQETYASEKVMNRNDIRVFLGYPSDYPLHEIVNDIIAYLRKSRKDEELYGNEAVEETLARHLKTIQEWAIGLFGIPIPEKNIKKEVVSGETIEGRPVMQEVLSLIESPHYRAILCIDVQRLSRGDLEDQGRLCKSLVYSNTKVLTPSYFYDLSNKYEKKFFEQKMRESSEYLEYSKEKMGDGRVRSVLDRTWPHSTAPYGFSRAKLLNRKGYTLEYQKDECAVCKLAVSVLKNGLYVEYKINENDSWSSIAKLFGITKNQLIMNNINVDFKIGNTIKIITKAGTSIIANYFNFLGIKSRKGGQWTPAMVRNILLSLSAHGYVSWGKRQNVKTLKNGKIIKQRPINQQPIIVRGMWKPIYTDEEIDVINRYFSHNQKPINKANEMKNPLVSLVKCEICGSNMQRRPYYANKSNKIKRVYSIDKEKLRLFLRDQKDKQNLSINDIARASHLSRDIISHIFAPNCEKFTIPKSEYWLTIKEALKLQETEFDTSIMTVEEKNEAHVDTLICTHKNCSNISSDLDLIEKKIIESLKDILSNYKDYIKNYAEKIKEEQVSNELSLEIIDSEIKKANNKLNKICDLLEDGTYTQQLFNERKTKLDKELSELEKKKKKLSSSTSLKRYTQKKKMIPSIENVLSSYDKNLNAEQKNRLLSSIIEKVYYKKIIGGRYHKDDFELKIYLKI